ncbi:hypothetical protein HN865_04195 [Candidatus Woesearchaeota archaeon]|jgi:hypothetical protein|nr:hypothetical protein [Candidatus Woesearchaeota archaeon]MBT7238030.1 hypothetical protein [Candidatus Woesearchaeota archaeon]
MNNTIKQKTDTNITSIKFSTENDKLFFQFLKQYGEKEGLGLSTFIRRHLITSLDIEFRSWKKRQIDEASKNGDEN